MDESSDNDTVKALQRLEAALKVNPWFVPALRARAHVLIYTEQFEAAQEVLEAALKVNENDAMTLSMIAACRLLLEDDKGFEKTLRAALKINRRFAAGVHRVAMYAVRQHRYKDAIALEKRALKLDSEFAPAYVGLGMGYSRVGKDTEANEALQKAFELDSYNVKAFNMTEHFYDGPVKQMTWTKLGRFRLRAHKSEAKHLAPIMGALLKEAHATHKKSYGFTPKAPLHIEVFRDPTTFAVRSTGYPGLGAAGICFGHVVTMRSPSEAAFNWAMVLWHELAHVWHIQMSNSRVPRWFTEGLAEYDSTRRRPEWKREMNAALWDAHKSGRLKPIGSFNTMFTGAKNIGEIVLAYYYASKVVMFIDRTWGFEVFPKMLRAWGKRQPTEAVFQEVLGLSLDEFDARLDTWMEDELLVAYRDDWVPSDKEPVELRDAWKAGLDALKAGNHEGAKTELTKLVGAGKDGVTLRLRLADAAMLAEDWPTARTHLEEAMRHMPQRTEIQFALAKVLTQLKDSDAEYALMKAMSMYEGASTDILTKVLERAEKRGAAEDLAEFSERLMHVAPLVPETRMWRAKHYLAADAPKKALAEIAVALDLPGAASTKGLRDLESKVRAALGK